MSNSRKPIVVMMCGVSGSGKTTLAQRYADRGYTRLSLDEMMWFEHGQAGVDYQHEQWRELADKTEILLRQRLVTLINNGCDAVIDMTFCKRKQRDFYKRLITDAGGEPELCFCDADFETLRQRLRWRDSLPPGPDNAYVSDEMLSRFYRGFERPTPEEEKSYSRSIHVKI